MTRFTPLLVAAMSLFACADHAALAEPSKIKADPNGPRETAILAGGCFWGMENVLRGAPGIARSRSATPAAVDRTSRTNKSSDGDTGHAESVRVVFDPNKISYADLLAHWYFRGHDPTQLNHQNNDVGTQYRSEIFTTTPEQAKIAEQVKAKVAGERQVGQGRSSRRSSRRPRSCAPRTITRTT